MILLTALLAVLSLQDAPGFETLVQRIQDPARPVTTRAEDVAALADLGTDEACAFLVSQFQATKDRILRRALMDGMLRARVPDAGAALLDALVDPDAYLRAHALEALARQDPVPTRARARSVVRFDEDPRVRAAAIRALADGADEDTARFLLETCAELSLEDQREAVEVLAQLPAALFAKVLLDDSEPWYQPEGDPGRRLLAALTLAARAEKASKKLLGRLAKDEDRRVAFAAALGLDRVSGRGSGAAARKALTQTKDADDRYEVLQVVQRSGLYDPILIKVLLNELGHKDWRIRAAAAESLAGAAAEEAVPPVTELLREEKSWQVQVACLRALAASRQAAAVEPLIQALDELTGRLEMEASLALGRLTGMNLGTSPELWRRWWEDHREGFVAPPADRGQWADLVEPADRYAFYGVPVYSDRLAFVLDVSGSMQGDKLNTLKVQLAGVIERLPDRALFNMVFFDHGIYPWEKKLVPLNASNRSKALGEVRYREAGGSTNLYGAMLAALEDERVDSIYLLSDGQPTSGEITNLSAICRELQRLNVHRRVAFHVILVGYRSDELRELALGSGGTYLEAR